MGFENIRGEVFEKEKLVSDNKKFIGRKGENGMECFNYSKTFCCVRRHRKWEVIRKGEMELRNEKRKSSERGEIDPSVKIRINRRK